MSVPKFKDLNKPSNDVLNKKFPSDQNVEFNSRSTDANVTFKATAARASDGAVNSSLEMTHVFGNGIKLTETWDASNDLNTKLEYAPMKGLKLTGETLLKTKSADQKVTLAAAYATPKLNFNAKANPIKAALATDVVFKATDNIFVGVKADVSAKGLASDPVGAVSYRRKDFALFASTNGKKVTGDAFHQVNASTKGAFAFNFNVEKSAVDVSLGLERKDNGSTYKLKALSKGVVGASFSHPIKEGVALTFAAEVSTRSLQIDAHKVGLSLEFA